MRERLRLALIGAGWITPRHLEAFDRLDRTTLVGVASARIESAEATARPRGIPAYADVDRLLDEQRPDAAYVAVPPSVAVAVNQRLVDRAIPFLTEKPLAATDPDGPARLAAAIGRAGLVVAVGYHLRALAPMPEVRDRLRDAPPHLVTARWLSGTPAPAWWLSEAAGGGQVIEQATHFYDLARHLVGEATVVAAASTRSAPVVPAGSDLADATGAILRFHSGAIGTFSNTRRLANAVVEMEFASADLLVTVRRIGEIDPGSWEVTIADSGGVRTFPPARSPYEGQAEAFLDAVEARDPRRVLSSYADAVLTDRLTRAVVAATGDRG